LNCKGVNDGTVTIVPAGGPIGTSYDIDWDTDARGDFDDLLLVLNAQAAGTYCVNIRDDNLCVLATDSCFTIAEPDSIYFPGSIATDVQCNGDNDGDITLVTVGGTEAGAYDYLWNPVPGCYAGATINQNMPNLCPGTYTVTATDDNGCTNDTTFSITEPILLTAPSSHNDAGCGLMDGDITVTPAGGTGAITITWVVTNGGTPIAGNSNFTPTNLLPGTYTGTVMDANGCTVTVQEIVITETPPLVVIDNVSNLICNGDCAPGGIQTTVSGGLAPYTIAWTYDQDGSYSASTDDIFNLCAGDYTISVTDANMCATLIVQTITEPAILEITNVAVTNLNCFQDNSGAIDVTVAGGTVAGAYTYSWTGPNSYNNNTEDITGLEAGTFCFNFIDDNGCTLATDSCIVITEPTPIVVTSITSTPAQCNVPNGSATVVASGGTVAGGYSYSWTGLNTGAVGVNAAATGNILINDSYTVIITDDNGCTQSANVAVIPTNGPAVTIDATQDVDCANASNGFIHTSGSGGTGALTFTWTDALGNPLVPDPGNVQDLDNIPGGTYILTVTDGALCNTNSVINIFEPLPMTINDNIIPAVCFGGTGTIDVSVNGGTLAPGNSYGFDWDNNGVGAFTDPEDLVTTQGTYNVLVIDDNNCVLSGGPYTINQPTQIVLTTSSPTQSACLQATGSVSVVAQFGTPGVPPNEYTYVWTDVTNTQVGNTATTPATLLAGCYDVLVTDINGCTMTATQCVTDLNGPTLTDNSNNVVCNGGSGGALGDIDLNVVSAAGGVAFSWTALGGNTINPNTTSEDINGLLADDYSVVATDANGCVSGLTVTITEPVSIDVDETITNINCANGNDGAISIVINNAVMPLTSTIWTGPAGYAGATTQDISGLSLVGQYCVTVTDGNGCTYNECFNITAPSTMTITATPSPTDCNNPTGFINALANGGSPGYIYSWVGPGNPPNGSLASGLNVGSYTVTATDINGCTVSTSANIVTMNGPNVVVTSTNNVNCFGGLSGDVFVTTTVGAAPYTFDWDNLPGAADPEDNLGIAAGTYVLDVLDAAGCAAQVTATITEPAAPLAVTGIASDLNCNNDGSGSISITITGGTVDYDIVWTESGNNVNTVNNNLTGLDTQNGLNALTYTATITDANGCVVSDSYTLIEPTAFTVVATGNDPSCGNLDGELSAVANGGTLAGGNSYSYSWIDFVSGNSTVPVDNLANISTQGQGTYQVTATDDNGCTAIDQVSISDIGGPTVTETHTDINCFGDLNGSIDLTVAGNPGFTFSWTVPVGVVDPGNVEDPNTGIGAGTYSVAVQDGNGCITNQLIVIGGPTAPISLADNLTNLSCNGDGLGQIDITISGGTGPFTAVWTSLLGYSNTLNNINATSNINGLSADTYTVNITDANSCTLNGTSYVITEPAILAMDPPTITKPTCGLSDGTISINVTGGTVAGSYGYTWTDLTTGLDITPALPNPQNVVTPIGAGNYQVDIIDDNGCTLTQIIAVSNDQAPAITDVVTLINCNGGNNGAIDITVGTLPNTYLYDWDNDGTGDTDDTQDLPAGPIGLTAGTYTVIVYESPTGCISTATYTLSEPTLLDVTENNVNLDCFGDGSGMLDITISGGTLTYNTAWDNLTNVNDPEDQSNVGAGNYQVTVTDGNGCVNIQAYTLTQPGQIDITAVITNNTCNGDAFGAIDVTVVNFVGTPQYTWDTPSNVEDETLLLAGNYLFSITDDNGCIEDSLFTITEPSPIIFSATVQDANCNQPDGNITTNVSGGTLAGGNSYTYDWSTGGSSVGAGPDLLLQAAGTYLFTVTDDNACSFDTLISINNLNAPLITLDNISDVTCFGDADGQIDITIAGGTAPYNTLWNPGGISSTEDLTAGAGTYNIQVVDASGCISTMNNLIIGTPDVVDATIVYQDATCGVSNGSATATGIGGDGSYTYLWGSGNTAQLEPNLGAGLYTVQVTDGSLCTANVSVTLNDLGGPTGETIITNDVSCNGGNDGDADVTAIGGTGVITYFWPHNGHIGGVIGTLTAGTYFVEMTDVNGCTRIAQVDINEPDPIVISSQITPSTCGNTDGDITVSVVSGGVAPLTVLWATGETTFPIGPVSAGTYTAVITDNNGTGCSVTQNVTVTDVNAPQITLTPNSINCNGDLTGSITSVTTGAVGAMSYQWADATPSNLAGEINPDLLNSGAGTFTITGTDAGTGCIVVETATITEPTPLVLSIPSQSDASCNIACDGQATVIASGGTLAYSYLWSNGETASLATALCVGVNTVTISDGLGCTIQTSVVTDFTDVLTGTITPVDAVCGLCDGTANIVAGGGTGNYTINWYDNTTGPSHNALCAGVYPATIIDNGNGCSLDVDVAINNIGGPDNETITQNDVTCNGGNDGDAIVVPSGGTQPYTYLWSPSGETVNNINTKPAGTYNLTVADANGCIRIVPVTINEPVGMNLSYTSIDANCGSSDGSISILVANGVGAITYSWAGPSGFTSANATESALEAGLYTVTVTDANCTEVIQVPLNTSTPPSFTVVPSDVSCFGLGDGSATANGINLTYVWQSGATNPTEPNLSQGTYFVTATDIGTGCIASQSVDINEPDSLMLGISNTIDPLCFGDCNGEISAVVNGGTTPYTYAWSSSGNSTATEPNLCDGLTTLTITDPNGCTASDNFTLVEPTILTITIDNTVSATCVDSPDGIIDITAGGGTPTYSYSWITIPASTFTSSLEDLTGLLPTTYQVTVTDANGCTMIETAGVDTTFIVLADAGIDTSLCLNECIVLNGSGIGPAGISFEWNSVPTGIVPISTADTAEVCPSNIGVTQYTLTVFDANCSNTDTVDVDVYPLPIVDAGADIEDVLGINVTLGGSPTGPTGSTYFWTPNTNFLDANDADATNPEIELLETEDYVVFATDINGCINSDTIHVRPIPQIVYPNGFTPNGDGVNDVWVIDYIDQFEESVVEIYNRWGEMLFRSVAYTHQWDGKYNGEDLPVGTYYYIIELNDPLFPETYSGPITIMR